MSIFAIAAFIHDNNPVGARMLNTDTGKIKDCKNSDLLYLINSGYKFENLEIKDASIHWCQGSWERYPQIYSNNAIKNSSTAIVIGELDGEVKRYKVCNLEGKQVVITSEQLINHNDKFGVANCKKIIRNDKVFMQSISGEIPKLRTELNMKYIKNGVIRIDLPDDNSITELEIPSVISVYNITELESIQFNPKYSANAIRKLTIPSGVVNITFSLIQSMPNLEEVVIRNDRCYISDSAFAGLQRLTKVIMAGSRYIGNSAFEGCSNLTTIASRTGFYNIGPGAFKKCPNLDIQYILDNCKDTISGVDVFSGNRASELTLNPGMKDIDFRAFRHMPNLSKIIIEDAALRLLNLSDPQYTRDTTIYIKERSDILNEYNNIPNYGFPESCKIEIIPLSSESNKVKNIIYKSGFSNLSNSNTLTYYTSRDAAIILSGRSDRDVHDYVINTLNNIIRSGTYSRISSVMVGEYTLVSYVDTFRLKKCNLFGGCDDAVFYGNKQEYMIFPTNKQCVIECLSGSCEYLYKMYNTYYDRDADKLNLPCFRVKNHGKIDDISYKDNILHITFRNKNVIKIPIK